MHAATRLERIRLEGAIDRDPFRVVATVRAAASRAGLSSEVRFEGAALEVTLAGEPAHVGIVAADLVDWYVRWRRLVPPYHGADLRCA